MSLGAGLMLGLAMVGPSGGELTPASDQRAEPVALSPAELFDLADRAARTRNAKLAEKALKALSENPDPDIHNEARFRLAMLYRAMRRYSDAASLLRRILDERHDAPKVRLELALTLRQMGEESSALRELQALQAGGLPPDVARFVERFSAALRERKPFGFNVQLALAPDSNVNRATRSETLGAVLGEFDLDEDARQSSGIGVKLGAEAYYRRPVASEVSILMRAGFSGDFYGAERFNDLAALASVGPEFALLSGRGNLLVGAHRRWFGGERYNNALDASLQWQRPLGRQSQLRVGMGLSKVNYRFNQLQDSYVLSGSVGYERALDTRTGASLTLGATRQMAQESAYSWVNGQLSATAWRDIGRSTVFASASYQHLEADKRLSIYLRRRKEDFLRISLGATLRALGRKGWAPQFRVIREQNWSPIETYRYDRWRAEVGFARAF